MGVEYLNNARLEENIKAYRATINIVGKEKDFYKAEMELTKSFYLLAEKIFRAKKFQFVDYDEALQEGVMICFKKLHRFNPKIGKAFSFCTTVIINHYFQLYRSCQSYQNLKVRYFKHLYEKEIMENDAIENNRVLKSKKKISKIPTNDFFPSEDD